MKSHKKDSKSIYIPHQQVDQATERTIDTANHKAKIRKRVRIIGITAVCILFLFSTGFVSTSMTNVWVNIPYVESVFKNFTESGLQNAPQEEIILVNDAIFSNEDITIKVQEIFYDENSINIGYILATKEVSPSITLNLNYNNTPIYGGGSAFIDEIGDGVYYYLNQLYYEGELPETFDLEMSFYEDFNFDKKPLVQFTIPISKSIDKKNVTRTIMQSVSHDKETLRVNTITLSPVSTKIQYEYFYTGGDNQHEIQLIDYKGNILNPQQRGGTIIEMDKIFIENSVAIFEAIDFTEIDKIQLTNKNGEIIDLPL